MRKIIIAIILILILFSIIIGITLHISSKETITENTNKTLQEEILNNSKWILLNDDDFNGYLNGTYTKNINEIISSLEEARPVIFQISGEKFSNTEEGTFIVASSFNTSNKVYIYRYNYNQNKYVKGLYPLESILEYATSAFIYLDQEVPQ